MTAITANKAIQEACAIVGAPYRRSATEWLFAAPYRPTDPSGPSVEILSNSLPAARAKRAMHIAEVALGLLGMLDGAAQAAVWDAACGTVDELVRAGMAAHGTGPTAEELGFAASQY